MSGEDMKWHERKCAVTEAATDGDAAGKNRGGKRKIPIAPKARKARKE